MLFFCLPMFSNVSENLNFIMGLIKIKFAYFFCNKKTSVFIFSFMSRYERLVFSFLQTLQTFEWIMFLEIFRKKNILSWVKRMLKLNTDNEITPQLTYPHQAHDVRTTLLRCLFKVLTSFTRPYNVVLTSCVDRDRHISIGLQT